MNHRYIFDANLYILDVDGEPTPCADVLAWAQWYQSDDLRRQIASTEIGSCRVSTVFLGINHSFGAGQPVLWETMIFGGLRDTDGERYTSADAARVGHELWVLVAKGETTPEAVREMERALA
jgi:hypothetical protein